MTEQNEATNQEVERLDGITRMSADGKCGLSVYLDAETVAALENYRQSKAEQYEKLGAPLPTFGMLARRFMRAAIRNGLDNLEG